MDVPTRLLPLRLPETQLERLLLIAMRRMGAHGLHDAHAAMLLFNTFGLRFRQPLVLLRAFMLEVARGAERKIVLAPCCARRMTADEGRLLDCLMRPEHAHQPLRDLRGSPDVAGAHSVALVLAATL